MDEGESAGYSKLKMFYAYMQFEVLFSRGMRFNCGWATDAMAGLGKEPWSSDSTLL